MADLAQKSVLPTGETSPQQKPPKVIGIIGGSLLLQCSVFQELKQTQIATEFGVVNLFIGVYHNIRLVFCHRHFADSSSIYSQPANIKFNAIASALQIVGCDLIIGIYSVGSLKTGLRVGSLVVPHDYWNPFNIRSMTTSPAAHIIPGFHKQLRESVINILQESGYSVQDNAIYVQTAGPRFETAAEIQFFKLVGDIVGMTGASECELFSELKIPFTMLAIVDNYGNGISGELALRDFHECKVRRNGEVLTGAVLVLIEYFSSLGEITHSVSSSSKKTQKVAVDLAVCASFIVPVEPVGDILKDHAVVINDGKIVAIVPSDQLLEQYDPIETEYLRNHVIIPGLVNCHTHASMTLLRGLADDKPLCAWLSEDIWPAEAKFVNPEFVRDGTLHAVAEMIKGGTTCFNDMYYYGEESGAVLEQVGMRGLLGQIVLDFPTQYAKDVDGYFQKGKEMHERFQHSKLVRTSVAPHAPYTVSDATLLRVDQVSKELGIPIHIHLHETEKECEDSALLRTESINCHRSDMKSRPIMNFHRHGLLTKRMVAAHMVHLTDEEIACLTVDGTHVVHCPTSNLKLASGICRVTDLLKNGVNVAIGTDSAASNNTLDMFSELKLASLLAKAESKDCTSVVAAVALRMATLNGARALGWDKEIGSLLPGKWADMVALKVDSIETLPLYNILSHLVYVLGRESVSDVWVAGKRLLRNKRLTTIDEEALKRTVNGWNEKIRQYHDYLQNTSSSVETAAPSSTTTTS